MKRIHILLASAILFTGLFCEVYEPPRDNKNDPLGDSYVSGLVLNITVSPEDGSILKRSDSNIVLTFSEAALTTSSWTVTIDGTEYTSGTWSGGNTVLTITPSGDFVWGSTVTVSAAGFIAEYDGITYFPNKTFSFYISKAFPVSDSGQTECASGVNGDSTMSACPQTVTGQDGNYAGIPVAISFTVPTQHAAYTSDYTTTDNVTGLIWKTCTEGQSGADCSGGSASLYTWEKAVTACADLNSANSGAGYAGRTDWRLPSIEELNTLPDYGRYNPAIDTTYFPGTQSDWYWSSSAYVDATADAWVVNFTGGAVGSADKTFPYYARCVSGP